MPEQIRVNVSLTLHSICSRPMESDHMYIHTVHCMYGILCRWAVLLNSRLQCMKNLLVVCLDSYHPRHLPLPQSLPLSLLARYIYPCGVLYLLPPSLIFLSLLPFPSSVTLHPPSNHFSLSLMKTLTSFSSNVLGRSVNIYE